MFPPAPHLVDEILEEIFLRLPTPAALARASTACPRFRHIITERSFLRRFRKRHPPPLLGLIDEEGVFLPAEAPHPSAPLARALAEAADFTYSFVPEASNGSFWHPRDVRDGRVLLESTSSGYITRDFAVCDPLSRRYTLLPPIPMYQEKTPSEIKPMLVPIGEEEDETSFKVICVADFETKLVAFVFSSVAPKWSIATSTSWASLGGRPHRSEYVPYAGECSLYRFDYVRGCFYSASPWLDKLLVLDTRNMKFSTANNVLVIDMHSGIVVGREGTLEMLYLVGDRVPNGSFALHHQTRQNSGESYKHWQLENIIELPGQYHYFTIGADEGFLFLGATPDSLVEVDGDSTVVLDATDCILDYFSLEVWTSELVKVCRMKPGGRGDLVYWYFGFPPSLSKPSI